VPPLGNYCFPYSVSVTGDVTLSRLHCITCLPYSSKSRTVPVVLAQHDLFHSPLSNFFIITTVPFRDNNFAPHSSFSQITMLSFYHHDRYHRRQIRVSCIFHQYGYLACFNTTGTSHISLRQISWHISALQVHGIFQHDRYVTYFTTTNVSHFSPRRISCMFFHLCEILRFRSCLYCAVYIGR
jgi:hypothetical protein